MNKYEKAVNAALYILKSKKGEDPSAFAPEDERDRQGDGRFSPISIEQEPWDDAARSDLSENEQPEDGPFTQEVLQEDLFEERTVYEDEPLLYPASSMKNYMPPEYRPMFQLLRTREALYRTDDWLFFKQAQIMEDYEDDYPIDLTFRVYRPTYDCMSHSELRGYFCWRGKIRRKEYVRGAPGYSLVYIFELINRIGYDDAETGYRLLSDFCSNYSSVEPTIPLQLLSKRWLLDYVLYYGLSPSLIKADENDKKDEAVGKLLLKELSDREIFDALNTLYDKDLTASPVWDGYDGDLFCITVEIYKLLVRRYRTPRKTVFLLFGKNTSVIYEPFFSDVFYSEKPHEPVTVQLGATEEYRCYGSYWKHSFFCFSYTKMKKFNALMKNIDARVRQIRHKGHALKHVDMKELYENCLDEAVKSYYEKKAAEQEQAKLRAVTIDLSKLDSIRRTADVTRDKLIVEQEDELPEPEAQIPAVPQNIPVAPAAPQPSSQTQPLSELQRTVLAMLLHGEDADTYCRRHAAMLSVVCDEINEVLFDVFDDTVIETDDVPSVIEDYAEQVAALLGA